MLRHGLDSYKFLTAGVLKIKIKFFPKQPSSQPERVQFLPTLEEWRHTFSYLNERHSHLELYCLEFRS